jgi:2-polyprenyl-6-methoxyphenol hydroxylase-like FAD-dependent oxidoreductase
MLQKGCPMEHATSEHQVVIVGGGIAGGSLAFALASTGHDVTVLEATEHFDDRVRGESIMPWGVREAQQLGVAPILEAAGAHTAGLWRRYGEGTPPRDVPVGLLIPGVAGSLNLHHPTACQALLDAAVRAGATVERGVTRVEVISGARPLITYRVGDEARRVDAAVVVGADGRGSAVRRAVGIELERQDADGFVAGLLVEGVEGAADHDAVCDHALGLFLLIHQGAGRARAYHVVPPALRTRYAGAGGAQQFLRDAAAVGGPVGAMMTSARAAGPCAAVPGTDTWTPTPYVDGVVLVGDAAGHNDPTAGCGLSIAMRDVRIVRDLIIAGAQRHADFESYGAERTERMRRLRLVADVINAGCVVSGPDRTQRRARLDAALSEMHPALFPLILGMYAGPETIPAELGDGTAAYDLLRAA